MRNFVRHGDHFTTEQASAFAELGKTSLRPFQQDARVYFFWLSSTAQAASRQNALTQRCV